MKFATTLLVLVAGAAILMFAVFVQPAAGQEGPNSPIGPTPTYVSELAPASVVKPVSLPITGAVEKQDEKLGFTEWVIILGCLSVGTYVITILDLKNRV